MDLDVVARGARSVVVMVVAAILGVTLVVPPPASGDQCKNQTVTVGIVSAQGCFAPATGGAPGALQTSSKFQMNGFNVTPGANTSVVFTPASNNRAGTVNTQDGYVSLSADHPVFGTITFRAQRFAFAPPNAGTMVLTDAGLAQPFPIITGLTPVGVGQPIRLTEDGAEFDLSFTLGGLFGKWLTKSEKTLGFSIGFGVSKGQYRITRGNVTVSDFNLAEMLKVNEAEFDFEPPKKVAISFDAAFGSLAKGDGPGIVGGASYEDGKLSSAKLGVTNINKMIGTSGVYLQKLIAEAFPSPPYGAKGTVGISAGPKVKFLGKDVTAVAVDGSVEIRGADPDKKKPGYFSTTGNVQLVTLPVANARFTYYFGQGTEFGANFGIGLPSGTNDPNQPTFIGGNFNGWTSARNFSLDGTAGVKVFGIQLITASSVVSDIGIAACGQIVGAVGGGIRWSDGRFDGFAGWTCDLGPWKRQRPATAAMSDGARSIPLELNDQKQFIRVSAPDDQEAPSVTLLGDDGEVIKTPSVDDEDGIRRTADGAALRTSEEYSIFALPADSAGDWRLRTQPDSSPVESIDTARALPDHNVRARIVGRGATRTLTWSARDIPYQKLQFVERMPDGREVAILRTSKPSGSFRFRPVEGMGTHGVTRKLAVDVLQRAGTPRDQLVADRYVVRRAAAPGRVRGLTAHRQVGDIVARWNKAPRAARYEVTARPRGGGITYRAVVGAGRRHARLSVGTTDKLVVTVTPLNRQGRSGRPARTVLTTDHIVPDRKTAAQRLAGSARLAGKDRVVAQAVCPDVTMCTGAVKVVHGDEVLGMQNFTVPPDMADRVVVPLRGRGTVGGPVRVLVTVDQLGQVAAATRRVS